MKDKIFKIIYGNKLMFPFWIRMLNHSISGINSGLPTDFSRNGEAFVLDYIGKMRGSSSAGRCVFDVGANNGKYSAELIRRFGEDLEIHSFEPQIAAYRQLVNRFCSQANMRINNLALSNVSGSATLFKDSDKSDLASLSMLNYSIRDFDISCSEVVETETLDNYCKLNGIDQIFFLKIDTEGHDFRVLQGASEMINAGKINAIQFEFGYPNISSRIFLLDFWLLLRDKFSIFRMLRDGLVEIKEYSPRLEIFDNTNYFCLLKDHTAR